LQVHNILQNIGEKLLDIAEEGPSIQEVMKRLDKVPLEELEVLDKMLDEHFNE